MHYRQHLSFNQLIDLLRPQQKTLEFCVYIAPGDAAIRLDSPCVIESFPLIDDDDQEIYPDYVLQQGLEFCFSDALLEDVIMSALLHKPTASNEELLAAIDYYAEHDCFMSFEPPASH
jgi:hypothetical protein